MATTLTCDYRNSPDREKLCGYTRFSLWGLPVLPQALWEGWHCDPLWLTELLLCLYVPSAYMSANTN